MQRGCPPWRLRRNLRERAPLRYSGAMCRLFGFRSVIQSQVHRSLTEADNALQARSAEHPDGWGVAYYVEGTPHLIKSSRTALDDHLFHRVSGVVASETVIAHVRKATQGENSILNCHPFQHGRWVFAHNGDIPNFDRTKGALLARVAPALRRFVLGDTDSEVVWLLFLSELMRYGPLDREPALADVMEALAGTVRLVRELCDDDQHRALLTMIVTNGRNLAALRSGKELYWSSYKTRCSERDTCPSKDDSCEAPSTTGFVNHLVVSSEPLEGENVWLELAEDSMVGVDGRMQMRTRAVHQPLPVLN